MNSSSCSRQPIDPFIRVLSIVAGLTIGYFLLQISGTSRQTTCKPAFNQAVTCQSVTQDFLWSRTIKHPPFQLQSAYISSSYSSESDKTSYEIIVSGLQANGKQQVVTMQFYSDDLAQARGDLNHLLALQSGKQDQPIVREHNNSIGIILLLMYGVIVISKFRAAAHLITEASVRIESHLSKSNKLN
jgi:hypothetical protein